jgi:putative oxidoreductase
MDAGLLLARLAIGLLMAAHGSQKLLGWFGGYGLDGTGGFFEAIGFRPGRLFAAAAAVSEVGGGVLLAIGLFEPVAAALIV